MIFTISILHLARLSYFSSVGTFDCAVVEDESY